MVHFSEYSGRSIGGRAGGTRHQHLDRRRGMGGAGGTEGGLPTEAGALDGWVAGRERGGRVCDSLVGGTELGRKDGPHRGFQEAYDVEFAAIARALAVAAERAKRRKLGRVRIFTDAQAITRMTHDEPGPGQT